MDNPCPLCVGEVLVRVVAAEKPEEQARMAGEKATDEWMFEAKLLLNL